MDDYNKWFENKFDLINSRYKKHLPESLTDSDFNNFKASCVELTEEYINNCKTVKASDNLILSGILLITAMRFFEVYIRPFSNDVLGYKESSLKNIVYKLNKVVDTGCPEMSGIYWYDSCYNYAPIA